MIDLLVIAVAVLVLVGILCYGIGYEKGYEDGIDRLWEGRSDGCTEWEKGGGGTL